MPQFQRIHTSLGFSSALLGLGCALIGAPLIRSLPEIASLITFFTLMPLTLMLGLLGVFVNGQAWRTTQQWRYVVGLLISLIIFVILVINFSTPWLWPYPPR